MKDHAPMHHETEAHASWEYEQGNINALHAWRDAFVRSQRKNATKQEA